MARLAGRVLNQDLRCRGAVRDARPKQKIGVGEPVGREQEFQP